MVYGIKTAGSPGPPVREMSLSQTAKAGENLFQQKCAFCHYSDKTETKVGPGLKGISRRATLPVSGLPVSDENLRKQLTTPFAKMPPFPDLSEAQTAALIAYLKSL